MKTKRILGIHNIDILLMCFIFLLLFLLPVIFTRVGETISWRNVFKIWQDRALIIPIFLLNHWLLVPKLMLRKKYKAYIGLVTAIIIASSVFYYFHDEPNTIKQREAAERSFRPRPDGPPKPVSQPPASVPPYVNLLMFSLLIVAVDTGLSLTKSWHQNEED
ncbi:MAG: hypothetical protein WCK09_09250, partial [Bacteroidota bacterium]